MSPKLPSFPVVAAIVGVTIFSAPPLRSQSFTLVDATTNGTASVVSSTFCTRHVNGSAGTSNTHSSGLTGSGFPAFALGPGATWDHFGSVFRLHGIRGKCRIPCQGLQTELVGPFSKWVPQKAYSSAFAMFAATGSASPVLTIHAESHTNANWHDTFNASSAFADARFNATLSFRIDGVPAGTPVTVYFSGTSRRGFGSLFGRAPNNNVFTNSAGGLTLNGNPLIAPPAATGSNAIYGNMSLAAGTTHTLAYTKNSSAWAPPPGQLSGTDFCDIKYFKDNANAFDRNRFTLSFSDPGPPGGGGGGNPVADAALYSLDIGSDLEFSETNAIPGAIDPADILVAGPGPLPFVATDDSQLFLLDPPPDGSNNATSEFGSNNPSAQVAPLYADVDAYDEIGLDLLSTGLAPGFPAVPLAGPVDGLFAPTTALVSFDDDPESGFTDSSFDFPVAAPVFGALTRSDAGISPVFGSAVRRDEIQRLDFSLSGIGGGGLQANLLDQARIFSETEFAAVLAPDPPVPVGAIDNTNDDDVDALDLRYTTPFPQPPPAYFSVDHEATYGLDPGTIYQVTPGGPVAVISPVDLGLPAGADVNACEFATIPVATGGAALVLVFSTRSDDPATPADESGGLDPGDLHLSYLDGNNELFATGLPGLDLDALAFTDAPFDRPISFITQTGDLDDGTVGSLYADRIAVAGAGAIGTSFTLGGGTLPPGLALSSGGFITGTPALDGTFVFDVEVTDSTGTVTTGSGYQITIHPGAGPLAISVTGYAGASLGDPLTGVAITNLSGGSAPYLVSLSSGSLPCGAVLDPSTGQIGGSAGEAGTFNYTLEVTDTAGATASDSGTIEVFPPGGLITSIAIDTLYAGSFENGNPAPGSLPLALAVPLPPDAAPPFTWYLNQVAPLPSGGGTSVQIDPGGAITFTPAGPMLAPPDPLIAVSVQVVDSPPPMTRPAYVANKTIYFSIAPPGAPPGSVVSLGVPGAVGMPWQEAAMEPIPISGGVPPYQLGLAGGSLPAGLTLDVPGQQIVGTAAVANEETRALLLVTDSAGNFDVATVEFHVDPASSSPPGDYASWKAHFGVGSDDESTDSDPWPALVEYYFGYDPTQFEPGGALQIVRLGSPPGFPNHRYHFITHPRRGVPDACGAHQVLELNNFTWLDVPNNPIPWPAADPFIMRLKVEPK